MVTKRKQRKAGGGVAAPVKNDKIVTRISAIKAALILYFALGGQKNTKYCGVKPAKFL